MKRFFTALCVFCFTAVFASAEEPQLIVRPLSWTIDSIQIVWNIEEKQTENYEWRSISDQSKTSSVDNTNLSRNTNTATNTSSKHFSTDTEFRASGGFGFSPSFLFNWGLKGSAGMSTGLGWKKEDSTSNTRQNEWVKSENSTSKATESEDKSEGNQTLRYNRKLIFTVNFVNHSDEDLIFLQGQDDIIPIYCGNEHLGDARPVNIDGEFVIPHHTAPKPCQFQMSLDDSSKMKLLESSPDIRILGSQIKIYNEEKKDVFIQSTRKLPSYTVRMTADNASREWEFKYNKSSSYTLSDVLKAINEDCDSDENLFELADETLVSVAGIPLKPVQGSEVFVLLAWNGNPVTDLKDLKPRKNCILDVILVSRPFLETIQSYPLKSLVPFEETLEKWAKAGLFDGKYLALNLLTDEKQRNAEIKKIKLDPMNIQVPDDFETIEEAYANVKDGGTITIKPGKYELAETLVVDRNVTFRGSTGKAEDVVVDCPTAHVFSVTGSSPSFQNLTASSSAEASEEDPPFGFYITGGAPKLFGCVITSSNGRGIQIEGKETDPKVEKCIIKNCGRAGALIGKEARGEFRNCEIYGNAASGIVVQTSGNPTVTGCKIHDGKDAGVLVWENGLGKFNDCEIYGNEASGIVVETSGDPTFSGCKIHDGKNAGVYVYENGLGTFNDCEIYGNAKPGIRVETSGNPTFTGCKIHDGKMGGVYVYDGGKGTFNNNTLKDNYTDGELDNWDIESSAGKVKGSGNTPEIPKR